MTEPDLHQIEAQVQKLKADFEKHLAIEELRAEASEKWRQMIDERTEEMYKIMTEGKQSWKTILFAGSLIVGAFSFLTVVAGFVYQVKQYLASAGK